MANFTVKTGFGYLVDSKGDIVSKCELLPGKHPLKEGYEYVEVDSREAMNAVEIAVLPLSEEEIREQKIQDEMRRLAEDSLIARGEL